MFSLSRFHAVVAAALLMQGCSVSHVNGYSAAQFSTPPAPEPQVYSAPVSAPPQPSRIASTSRDDVIVARAQKAAADREIARLRAAESLARAQAAIERSRETRARIAANHASPKVATARSYVKKERVKHAASAASRRHKSSFAWMFKKTRSHKSSAHASKSHRSSWLTPHRSRSKSGSHRRKKS